MAFTKGHFRGDDVDYAEAARVNGDRKVKAFNTFNILCIFAVTFGSLTYGYSYAIATGILGQDSFYTYFDLEPNSSRSNVVVASLNGLFAAAGAIGAIFLGFMGNKLSRRRAILLAAVISTIGGALQGGSVNVAMLLVSRFIGGLGVGMVLTIVPVYQSEISKAHVRGGLVAMHATVLCFGYAAAGYVNVGCYYSQNPTLKWRFPLASQCIPSLGLLLVAFFIPESPRWLIRHGQKEEALEVILRLHHDPDDENQEYARREFEEIVRQTEFDAEQHAKAGKFHLFTRPSYRKRMLMGFFVQFSMQSTGCMVINNYQVLLFDALGLTGYIPLVLNAVYNTYATINNGLCAFIVDRYGRVRLYMIGIAGCMTFVCIEAALVANFSGTTNHTGNSFGVVAMFGFITFYALLIDPIAYIYSSEIFPTEIRPPGVAFSSFGQFVTSLVYLESAPTGFATAGWKFYLLFILLSAVNLVVVYMTFPETKGLPLEKIGILFGDEIKTDEGECSEKKEIGSNNDSNSNNDSHTSTQAVDGKGQPESTVA